MASTQFGAYAFDEKVGQSITFCPLFFTNNSYSNDVLKRGKRPVSVLGEHSILTYEQTFLHELSHCWNMIGGPVAVIDPVNRYAGTGKVYGARSAGTEWAWACEQFGKGKCQSDAPSINRDTTNTGKRHSSTICRKTTALVPEGNSQ